MSKNDNIIIVLRDDHIIIKDKNNNKKYKIVLSGQEGIELKIGRVIFGIRDGNMDILPISYRDLMMDNFLNNIQNKVLTVDPDSGLPLYSWK